MGGCPQRPTRTGAAGLARRDNRAGVALGDDDFTISIGVAAFPDDAKLKEEFLDKAEWAMQLAKRRGRDQVVPFAGADAGQYASAAELDHASHS